MVTKYKIPCSCCGKLVERFVFCSGACKVKGHRERQIGKEVVEELPREMSSPVVTKDAVAIGDKVFALEPTKKPGYHYSAVLNGYVKD